MIRGFLAKFNCRQSVDGSRKGGHRDFGRTMKRRGWFRIGRNWKRADGKFAFAL